MIIKINTSKGNFDCDVTTHQNRGENFITINGLLFYKGDNIQLMLSKLERGHVQLNKYIIRKIEIEQMRRERSEIISQLPSRELVIEKDLLSYYEALGLLPTAEKHYKNGTVLIKLRISMTVKQKKQY